MAQAKWLVRVDWNDDGDFSDSNEDVTSDVLGLTLEHLRDLSSGHIESARLEMELTTITSTVRPTAARRCRGTSSPAVRSGLGRPTPGTASPAPPGPSSRITPRTTTRDSPGLRTSRTSTSTARGSGRRPTRPRTPVPASRPWTSATRTSRWGATSRGGLTAGITAGSAFATRTRPTTCPCVSPAALSKCER